MSIIYKPTKGLLDVKTHYCPGCGHGIVHKLIGEVLEELDILNITIAVVPVGCSVLAYNYFACDAFEAAHGRAPAVATGIKRSNPDKVVFTYQGDGDLAAIGTAEIIHAATRGENIVTIFINNCIYGMTGGQMAPTTLPKQITETTPYGRDPIIHGNPLKISEIISNIDGVCYVERTAINNLQNINKSKRAIKKAFQNSIDKKGFSFVEILSICPTNWGLTPKNSMMWLEDNMIPYYPLGIYKSVK